MQIIRIEHKTGNGMFRTNGYSVADLNLDDLIERHAKHFPTPYKERGRWIESYEFCAFKTIEQVQDWITKDEMVVLLANDYKVWLLDVSECEVYHYQCIYCKENIIQQKDISGLFKIKTK